MARSEVRPERARVMQELLEDGRTVKLSSSYLYKEVFALGAVARKSRVDAGFQRPDSPSQGLTGACFLRVTALAEKLLGH